MTPARERGAPARADRRAGERWTRSQALKNAVIRVALRALLAIVDRLPVDVLRVLGRLTGRVAAWTLTSARATARRRARRALPEVDAAGIARACFARAGENLAVCALLRRPGVRACEWVTLSEASRAVLTTALAQGRGAIVVSAHLGPFELVPAVVAELGLHPAVVVRESYDPALDPLVDAHRRGRGVQVIHRGAPGSAYRVVRALRRGQPVGLLPDLGGRRLPTVPVRFMGEPIAFPVGPAELAARIGCPLLVGVLMRRAAREGPSFELVFEAVNPSGPAETVTQRVASRIEAAILRSPEDWLWMAPPHLAIAEESIKSLSLNTMRHSELGRV